MRNSQNILRILYRPHPTLQPSYILILRDHFFRFHQKISLKNSEKNSQNTFENAYEIVLRILYGKRGQYIARIHQKSHIFQNVII